MPKLNDQRRHFLALCRDGIGGVKGDNPCTLGANSSSLINYCKRAGWVRGEKRPYIDSRMSWKRGWPWKWHLTPEGEAMISDMPYGIRYGD